MTQCPPARLWFVVPNVEVTGAARLYRAASVWTAGLAAFALTELFDSTPKRRMELSHQGIGVVIGHCLDCYDTPKR